MTEWFRDMVRAQRMWTETVGTDTMHETTTQVPSLSAGYRPILPVWERGVVENVHPELHRDPAVSEGLISEDGGEVYCLCFSTTFNIIEAHEKTSSNITPYSIFSTGAAILKRSRGHVRPTHAWFQNSRRHIPRSSPPMECLYDGRAVALTNRSQIDFLHQAPVPSNVTDLRLFLAIALSSYL